MVDSLYIALTRFSRVKTGHIARSWPGGCVKSKLTFYPRSINTLDPRCPVKKVVVSCRRENILYTMQGKDHWILLLQNCWEPAFSCDMYSFNVLTVFYTFLVINLKCSSIVILAPNATFLQLKSDLPPQFAHLVIFYRILDIKTHICWLWEIFCVPINILELLSGEQLFHLYQHQNFILLVLDVRILSQNQKYLL